MTKPTLLGTIAVLVLTGCTPSPTSTPSASPTPSNIASTPSLSADQQALEDAKARVVEMWQVVDKVLSDKNVPITSSLAPILGDQALDTAQTTAGVNRSRGIVSTGSTIVEIKGAVTQGTSWIVTACVDRSGTSMVDTKTGKPVQVPPPRLMHTYTVQRPADGYLRIVTDKLGDTC